MNAKDMRGRWPQVLRALGVDESYLRNKHGPCPACGGTDRYRFSNHNNDGMFFCNQCGAGDGFKLLQLTHGWNFKTAIHEIEKIAGDVKPEVHREHDGTPRLRRTFAELIPATDSLPVRRYLQGRGLKPSLGLKAHPALDYYENERFVGRYPAMVGIVLNAAGEGVTLHCTYIEDGRKAPVSNPKKILPLKSGMQLPGASVRLQQHGDTLGIAEGIETAMAASVLFGLPVWSVLFDRGMTAFEPPEGVQRVTLFGDNDASFAGQSAAYEAAKKLSTAGIQADVMLPAGTGTDWNDVLMQKAESVQCEA